MKKLLPVMVCLLATSIGYAQIKGNPQMKGKLQPLRMLKTTSKLNPDLKGLYEKYNPSLQDKNATSKQLPFTEATQNLMQIKGNKVLVDFSVKEDINTAKAALQKIGVTITAAYGHVISGYIPINALQQIESMTSIRYAMPSYKPMHQPVKGTDALPPNAQFHIPIPNLLKKEPVISQGDTAQLSYRARNKYHVNGDGVKVGILSDSYNNLGTALKGVIHNELPGFFNPYGFRKPVQVVKDLESGGTDEGRGMAEIVHDVAPGSDIAFYTAFEGQADFAQGIQTLADKGCKVICDDVFYYAEPFFQDGIITQSVDSVKKRGVAYFTAAGNQSIRSYESDYRPSKETPLGPENGTAHNFSAPGDAPRYAQPVYIPSGGSVILSFQWDQSFFSASGVGATTDFDIYLTDINGNIVAYGASDNIRSGDPVEVFGFYNGTSNSTFFLTILKYAGPDVNKLKYIAFGSLAFYLTNPAIPGILAPALYGHSKAAGAISTGAAFYLNTPPYGLDTAYVESFSCKGGTPNYFDVNGNRIAPLIRKKPDIVAPDGGNTSFFPPYAGNDITEDADSYPNFFGTSAAAPHAAGVAALMIEAHKTGKITPNQIQNVLSSTASDMDDIYTDGFDEGYDFNTGYGFINAEKAVGKVYSPDRNENSSRLITAATPQQDSKLNMNTAEVYPNPFVQSFRVYLSLTSKEKIAVDLFSADGKKLLTKTVYQPKGVIDIDATSYKPGVYILKVQQGNFFKTIRLVKE